MLLYRQDRASVAYPSLQNSVMTVPHEHVELILERVTSTCEHHDTTPRNEVSTRASQHNLLPQTNNTTLRNCALVSRAWTNASQRVLFRRVRASGIIEMERLLSCFRSSPHLAAFTRDITITVEDDDSEYSKDTDIYVPFLTALCPLLKNVTRVAVNFDRNGYDDDEYNKVNQTLVSSIYTFIHTCPVTELILSGLCDFACLETLSGWLQKSGIKRLTLDNWNPDPTDYLTHRSTLPKRLSIPSVESLRLRALRHFWEAICVWSSYLPNLKHFEVSVRYGFTLPLLPTWCKVIAEGKFPTVKLESFIFEVITSYEPNITMNWPPLSLANIHARRLFLTIQTDGIDSPYAGDADAVPVRTIMMWWLASFQEAMAIHCQELTFTVHFLHVASVAEVWGWLDEVLSSHVHSEVHKIHFENGKGDKITETSYPSDVANIRSVLPRLAERDVLSFR